MGVKRKVQVGDQFGSRVVIQVGKWKPTCRRIARLMCLHCGVKTVSHERIPSSNCQLCMRNRRREDPEKHRAHL